MAPRPALYRLLQLVLAATLARPPTAAAAQSYLSFEDSVNVGAIRWGAVALGIMVAIAIVRYQIVQFLQKRRGEIVQHDAQENPEEDFRSRAQELGFRGAEYKNLKRIATRLAPKTPGALLVSTTGREYLVADLQRRSLKREREIAVLEGIRERLSHLADQTVHEREVVRLDTQLPVWVELRSSGAELASEAARVPAPRPQVPAPPPQDEVVPDGSEEGGETEDGGEPGAESQPDQVEESTAGFDDLASVQGSLIDLGVGGCAVEVDLQTSAGKIVEIWSADWEIYLPRVSGDVVSIEPPRDGRPNTLHLHFLDPNETELQAAMEDIRERDEATARRQDEGEGDPGDFSALEDQEF